MLATAGLLCSCGKIKDKLERLANAGKPKAVPVAEAALTPEEEAMNRTLENPALFDGPAKEEEVPKAVAFELNKSASVAVLGYHDFRERGGSPMLIAAGKFREQMQAIKDSKIPVIPLRDVLAWKRGEKNIPEEALVITMDDGWEGVYHFAFPVLKEMGFPFTIYLYSTYVNLGERGRSLSWEQIREMMAHGCEVGSHSVSHKALTDRNGKSEADYQLWLLAELRDSKAFLEKNLGTPVSSFAYPFGNHNDVIVDTAMQVGYESAVTVSPQKISWDTQPGRLSRYIIHGDNDTNFKMATSFRGRGEAGSTNVIMADAKDAEGNPLLNLLPAPDSTVTERQPLIQADLSKLGTVIPESIRLRISGLGSVPARFDPSTFVVNCLTPSRLRREECHVTVSFKRDASLPEESINWKFKINLAAAYVPKNNETPMGQPQFVPASGAAK